jgi:pyruvate/2-oxoacid:ferredoxin oxidoreductase beta subunit/Pyruvate/2-oxoacid:ferredoxin oxidoreductase gamma subunit
MGNTTYLAADAKLPYCRGCGHALVVRQLSRALEGLALPSRSIVLTTDIGCVGLADSLFPYVHTVHTTHGRSTAMAIGMALAEAVLPASGLKPIVMIGDGGAMIGLLHLVHAAQLNVDVTVLVHNNFLFGMTGGQHSAFTPLDWCTSTTPEGNRVPPLDILALLRAAHAGFLDRQFATDGDLNAVIADAIAYPGFSLVEILEICTGYGGLKNLSKGAALHEVASRQGYAIGRLEAEQPRPAFTKLYRREIEWKTTPLLVKDGPGVVDRGVEAANHHPLPPPPAEEGNQLYDREESRSASLQFAGALDSRLKVQDSKPLHIVIAGTAGERVQSSAALLCRAALSAGLYTTQKNDNPVTQGSGFSLSEICLSPQPIQYTGMESADVVIAVSQDGWNELKANGTLDALTPGSLLVLDSELESESPTGQLLRQPFRHDATPKRAALAAIAFWLGKEPVVPNAAWQSVLAALPVERRADVTEALRIGANLARRGGAHAA